MALRGAGGWRGGARGLLSSCRHLVAEPPPGVLVENRLLRHPDGAATAVLAVGDLELDSLDERGRSAAIEAFSQICRSLDVALQVAVRIRRIPPAWAGPPLGASAGSSPAGVLEAAMRDHWRRRLEARAVFGRSIFLTLTAAPGEEAALEHARRSIRDGVRRAGVVADELCGSELGCWLAESFPEGATGPEGWPWRETPSHAIVGSTWVRGHALRRLPGSAVRPGWLAPLVNVGVECDIALHLEPVSPAEAVSRLGRRLRGLTAQRLLDLDRGATADAWNDAAIESAEWLREGIARNQGRPLRLSLCAVARASDASSLERASRDVSAAFAATLSRAEPTTFQHLRAALTALPLGRDLLGSPKLVDSRAAATCLPWTSAAVDDPGGYRLGCQRLSGAPVRLAPFDASRYGNANIAILAASGHGKSFAIGTLVLEAAAAGVPAVIVDPEEEYRAVVSASGGDYLRLATGSAGAINIFEVAGVGAPGDGEAAQAVVDLAAVLCGGRLSELDRARVDRAAQAAERRAAAAARPAQLGDCLAELEETAPRVAAVLGRMCTGPPGRLFNRPSSIRIGAGVTGISLRDLHPELVPPAALLLARWLWRTGLERRQRRHIIFDEAGILALHPPLRDLLCQLARRCRKHGASLVVATQNARDLLATDEGLTVATNSAVLLLGGHRAVETAEMQRAFGLTEGQRRFLESAGRGEFLLVAGNRRAEIIVQVPELHRRLLSSPEACEPPPTAAEPPPR